MRDDATKHVIFANLADAQSGARKYDDAADSYRKAILLAPMESAYYNNLGIVLGHAGKIDEAVEVLERAARLYPYAAGQAYYNLGAVMTNAGRSAAAVEAFRKAIEFDPQNSEAYYQLGIAYLGSADTLKDAIPMLRKYLVVPARYSGTRFRSATVPDLGERRRGNALHCEEERLQRRCRCTPKSSTAISGGDH